MVHITSFFASVTSCLAVVAAQNPWADPNLVSMFDGTSLSNWTASASGEWVINNGSILHGTGLARGWIYYNKKMVGDFRWIFSVRRAAIVGTAHDPTVLIWGSTASKDALDAIQFQPPNSYHWDYRAGHNDAGNAYFTVVKRARFDVTLWHQCEIVGVQATGVAKMACCELATGATSCKAVEVIDFKDPTAGRVGPLAIQVHNAGIQDEYKNLWIESPVVTRPGEFITV